MDYKELTPEQIEKAKGMSAEELRKFADEEGVSLSDEDLEQIAGGWGTEEKPCSAGGDHDWVQTDTEFLTTNILIPIYTCKKCGATRRGDV